MPELVVLCVPYYNTQSHHPILSLTYSRFYYEAISQMLKTQETNN